MTILKKQMESINGMPGPTGLVQRMKKKARNTTSSALMAASIYFSRYRASGSINAQIRSDRTGDTALDMKRLFVKTEGRTESLLINKRCASTSFEQTETSQSIRMEFTDGSSLKVELETGSILAAYVARPNTNMCHQIDLDMLKEILENSVIETVSGGDGPPRKRNQEGRNTPQGSQNQELVFTRQDGTRLILELSPGAIRDINFFEN